jgi:hypothetical protein
MSINTLPCDYQCPSLRLSMPFLAIINALPCDLRCPSWMGRARTEANIKLEAAKRGVGAERILFTGKFGDDHLDYKRAATIFVDSPEYNAHVTNIPQSQRGVALCGAARRGWAVLWRWWAENMVSVSAARGLWWSAAAAGNCAVKAKPLKQNESTEPAGGSARR